MRELSTLFLSLFLLLGCAQSKLSSRGPDSVNYLPPAGSTVRLEEPLEIPAGHARVFIQQGETVSKQAFDRYVPSCNFEVRTLAENSRRIEPDEFLVIKVQTETAEVVQGPQTIQLAALVASSFYGGLPMVTRRVHLWVGSDLQPDVMRLTCQGAFDDMPDAQLPSIAQIHETLGKIAKLILP